MKSPVECDPQDVFSQCPRLNRRSWWIFVFTQSLLNGLNYCNLSTSCYSNTPISLNEILELENWGKQTLLSRNWCKHFVGAE